MLPQKHFLIAGLVITPVAITLSHPKSVIGVAEWVLVGGFLSVVIDIDIYALVFLKSKKENRLKPFRNPGQIQRKFKLFMDTITETGVLKTGLKTHLISSAAIILLSYYFFNDYFIPAALGVMSHIISDIPNLRRL